VALKWKDNATNEASYRVLRNGAVIATLAANATSYTDATVAQGTTYSYTVQAVNSTGASASAPVSVTTLAVNTPANLRQWSRVPQQINLSWTDLSTNESSFRVWRSTNAGRLCKLERFPAAPLKSAQQGAR